MEFILDMHSSVYLLLFAASVMLIVSLRLKDGGKPLRILVFLVAIIGLEQAATLMVGEFYRARHRYELEALIQTVDVLAHVVHIDGVVVDDAHHIVLELQDMDPQPAFAGPRRDLWLDITIRASNREIKLRAYQDYKSKTRFWVRGPGHSAPFAGMIVSPTLREILVGKRSSHR